MTTPASSLSVPPVEPPDSLGDDVAAAFDSTGDHALQPPSSFAPFERWAVTIVLLAMSIMPVLQMLIRKVSGADLGATVWVQHGTLWVGFLGALLASARGKHLGLSTVEFLPKKHQAWARIFSATLTAAVVSLLAVASLNLVLADR